MTRPPCLRQPPFCQQKKPATVSINHYLRRPVIYADENIDGSEKTWSQKFVKRILYHQVCDHCSKKQNCQRGAGYDDRKRPPNLKKHQKPNWQFEKTYWISEQIGEVVYFEFFSHRFDTTSAWKSRSVETK